MPTKVPPLSLRVRYEKAAEEYLRKLPLEHFAEYVSQAKQREITLASLDLLGARCPEVQVFNELLVQYPLLRSKRFGQVVPDNTVVIHSEPIDADWSFDLPLQPVAPFWVLDYVSIGNHRKDYGDNRRQYEHALKVPYYLLFDPEQKVMTLFHHTGDRYAKIAPDADGRCLIEELEIEVGLRDGWVRFWHRRQLLLLPAELQRELEASQQRLAEAKCRIAEAHQRIEAAKTARVVAEPKLAKRRARGKNGKN